MEDNNNLTAENQQATTQLEDNGAQRTFTQEEVNKIVSERLKREQNKRVDSYEYETRLKELTERENKFSCKEFVKSNGYSEELLEILDTSDVENFKKTAAAIEKIYSSNRKITTGISTSNNAYRDSENAIANAFK